MASPVPHFMTAQVCDIVTGDDKDDLEYIFSGSDDDFDDESNDDGLQEKEDALDRKQRAFDDQPGVSGLGVSPYRSPTPTVVNDQAPSTPTTLTPPEMPAVRGREVE